MVSLLCQKSQAKRYSEYDTIQIPTPQNYGWEMDILLCQRNGGFLLMSHLKRRISVVPSSKKSRCTDLRVRQGADQSSELWLTKAKCDAASISETEVAMYGETMLHQDPSRYGLKKIFGHTLTATVSQSQKYIIKERHAPGVWVVVLERNSKTIHDLTSYSTYTPNAMK